METVPSAKPSAPRTTTLRGVLAFLVTGGITTVAHVAAGLAAHHFLGLNPFNANLVAFVVGFLVGYFGHKTISFKSPSKVRSSMPKFFVVTLTNLVLNQGIVFVVSMMFGMPYWASLILIVIIVPISTYLLSRFWVFSDGEF